MLPTFIPPSSMAFSGRRIVPERFLEMVNERGLDVHHTTVFRLVQEYSPEIDKQCTQVIAVANSALEANTDRGK